MISVRNIGASDDIAAFRGRKSGKNVGKSIVFR